MHTLMHCCAQGVCCEPESPEQKQALADLLYENVSALKPVGTGAAWDVVDFLLQHFDVVPKGIAPYLHKIAAEQPRAGKEVS